MLYFLTSRPLWLSAMIIIGLGTSLSMLGPGLVRRRIRLERLTENNEIAGFKYAALGVLYAVLLAFAIIVVWQKFGDAETTVSQEAGAAATIYRLSQGLDVTTGAAVRDALSAYLERAIADDWPVMERGLPGAKSARQALDTLYAALLGSKSAAGGDNAVVSEILHQLDIITQSRRARLDVAEGVVPGVIWVVLLGGAVVTVCFTFFFGTTN